MFTYILYGLLIWFLYNLVFRFIIPVYRASRKMKQQFREMNARMREQMNPKQHNTATAGAYGGAGGTDTGNSAHNQKQNARPSKDDYLDFEEIR